MNDKIIDLSYLETISEGDREFKKEMIDTFLDSTSSYIDEMKACIETNNWKKIGDMAHSMKPSFTLMGMHENKELILKIESFGRRSENIQKIPDLVNQLADIISKASNELLIEKGKLM